MTDAPAGRSVLTSPERDFPRWYQDVVATAELAEGGPVRGTMVIRPYGYAIWERMVAELDARIKGAGAENAYFPLLIPESYLRREADHVEGFSPELAVVTHGGGKQLEEPAVVRPTSETIVNVYFSKWVQSYRDLPVLINQWANVVRWELRPRVFLRTTEFLWQEGHTAHASPAEACLYARRILHEVYESFAREVLAMPVLVGRKTERERFAGADATYTLEGMMGDGKALQMGTSHELGQNFSRPFDISFQGPDGARQYAWQTSWGVSTRLVGALIMGHGDAAGLRLPPAIAPIQVVVVLVRDDPATVEAAQRLAQDCQSRGLRTRLDDRTAVGFGRRAVEWEVKGVPIRLEVGPRDLARSEVTMVRRDQPGIKASVTIASAPEAAARVLEEIQGFLLSDATRRREDATVEADGPDAVLAILGASTGETGPGRFVQAPWSAIAPAEDRLAHAGITVRCLQRPDGSLPDSSAEADLVATLARAY
ncbi:MAG: proline--tRNA ligase [Acidimicrobiales bacterium]